MVRKVLWPWNAAALPEIMAEALQESKLDVPEQRPDGQAAGQQPDCAAGARRGGTAEARARPNVKVNRRAEGTSELNRRLGDGAKGDWALECCGVAGDYGRGWMCRKASAVCPSSVQMANQQASNQAAPPERGEVERQKPDRGLTLRLTGVPKARPS